MPISKLLNAGTTAATSADLVVGEGELVTFLLRGNGTICLQYKNSDATYETFDCIKTANRVGQVQGPMTVRAMREAVVAPWTAAGQAALPAEQVGLDVVTA